MPRKKKRPKRGQGRPRPTFPARFAVGDRVQVKPGTAEQRFCGTWFRCPRCHSAVLLPSEELEAQLASQRVKAATLTHIAAQARRRRHIEHHSFWGIFAPHELIGIHEPRHADRLDPVQVVVQQFTRIETDIVVL